MLIKFNKNKAELQNYQGPVSLFCPGCKQNGTFENVGDMRDMLHKEFIQHSSGNQVLELRHLMQRVCPNKQCRTHVFLVTKDDAVEASYPPIRLEFNSTDIPEDIVKTFDEALTCHANNCHTAAAIMVRKTMEQLCENQKAGGSNLRDRIASLGSSVTLPKELLEGLDHLRLLGNDAAHLESKHYNEVGQEELEVAIELTTEILKAVFQYRRLVGRMEGLQKTSITPTP